MSVEFNDPESEVEPPLPPGSRFGRYRVVRRIGYGGMGHVYEATHLDLGKSVALKVLTKEMSGNERAVARFMREGRAAARIRHPNVVDVTDVGVEDGVPYLVMELLEGEDLGSVLDRRGRLEVHEAVDVLLGVLAALQAAHDAGVIHRDLKPDNIFLCLSSSREIEPKVLDFGISKLVGPQDREALTRTSALMGTPYYMSPEQARGAKHVDSRTDQYAAAVVLYHAVCGRLPYADTDNVLEVLHSVQLAAITPPNKARSDLPAGFEDVLLRAMAFEPSGRYASVRELGAALLPYASEKGRLVWESTFGEWTSAGGLVDDVAATVRNPPSQSHVGPRTTLGGAAREIPTPPERWSVRVMAAALLGVAAAAVVVGLQLSMDDAPEAEVPEAASLRSGAGQAAQPLYSIEVDVEPADAIVELDGQPIERRPVGRSLPDDGQLHVLTAHAPQHLAVVIPFAGPQTVPPSIVLPALPPVVEDPAPPVAVEPAPETAPPVVEPAPEPPPPAAVESPPTTRQPTTRRRRPGSSDGRARILPGRNKAPIVW